MNKKETAAAIKKLHTEWRDCYNTIADRSWNEYVKTLPPSAMVPKKGVIYGKANQDEFATKTLEYRQRARDVVADLVNEVNKKKTNAPNDEALRALNAFKLREPKSDHDEEYQREVQTLIDRYGENYMVNSALFDMARKANVRVSAHPLAAEIDRMESVESVINRDFNAHDSIYHGGQTDGASSMFDWQIDRLFED